MRISVPLRTSAKAKISSFVYTEPVGFEGVLIIRTFVFSDIAFFNCCGVILNELASLVSIKTGTPPLYLTSSGYVTQ